MNEEIKKLLKELPKAWWRRTLPVVDLDTGEEFPKANENQWLPSVREDLDRLVERVHKTTKYSVKWAEEKAKTCKLCKRKSPNFCKRHSPRVIVETVKLYTEKQFKDNYLQGCKDMREAVKIEDIAIADFDGTNSTDITMRVGYNQALRHIKRKAQQFIDSLERKEDDTRTKNSI